MRACFYILILLTVLVQTQAQTLLIPEKLTIEDGLAQGFVSAIHQDQEGFLWFGTKNGLNRYDGRQFEKFTHNPDDLYSIAGDWVQTILEEGDFLIVSGHGDQLNLFHKRTKNFYSIPLNVNGVEYFSGILSVVKDIKEQYWITTNNSQVIRVTFPDQFWKQLPMQAELLAKVKIELVLKGYSVYNTAKDSNFLVLNIPKNLQIDINTLDTSTSNINDSYAQFRFFQPLTEHLRLGQSIVSPIELFSIYRFKEGIWNPILSDFSFLPYTYYDPSEDLVWLQRHDDNSLLAYKPDVLFNTRKITENQAAYLIKDVGIGIRKLYKDRSNILWVGTAGLGVIKISPRKLAVKNYLQGNSIKQQIFSFREGGLFFPMNKIEGITDTSTNTKVVNRFIDQIKPFKSFWLDEGFDQRWLAVVLKNSNLGAILRLYHYKDGKLNQKIQLPLSTVWFESELSMLLSKDRKLYISFSNYFIQYDPVVETHQTFQYNLFQQVVPIGFYIAQTANKNFWIGTSEGLIQVQAKQDSFDFQLITAGLRNKACASLLVDPNDANILWIGTKGGGLHRLDTKTMEFEHLYTQNGLPNNVIYGVLNDEEGNLWMSSNKGIINYHPRTGDIRNFTSADGMQSDEFNTFAFGKAMDGALMFGGINGLNIFYPKDLKGNPHTPAVKITGLAINNEPVSVLDSTNILETTIEFTDNITLNYSQNNITLDFAALEFTAPSKNTFSYYLEGAEAAWSHTTTDNSATYLNLAPGNYTFKIKAANGDLVWSEKVTTLDISIRPPWYRSTLAYGCYFLLLGFIFWWSRQLQRRRLQLKYSLELEQKEAERLKELDRFRSRLYTNITHEFRTPLTVILGTSEQMQAQKHSNHPEQRQLSLIRRNGKNLLNLVNQMLDLSKIEHN
ncbi:MAG: two-component regulator propeller domain-containing protein, partial [Bacteroidota bacterium]